MISYREGIETMIDTDCVGAVILAGATGDGFDACWADLHGQPVVAHALSVFAASSLVADVALVVAQERAARAREMLVRQGWDAVRLVAAEGPRVRDAIIAGTLALPDAATTIIIHDGARPGVTAALLAEGLRAVAATGAATAAVPVKDTIKLVDANGLVTATPDRATLYTIQTPQVIRRDRMLAAHAALAADMDVADAAQLVASAGGRVAIFPGAYANFLIASADDLERAREAGG
jgi:2-C-methyl-D-erythritol 4-phosphate cytidylyltransferase